MHELSAKFYRHAQTSRMDGRDAAADVIASFEHQHTNSRAREHSGGCKARHACADDENVVSKRGRHRLLG
jgi:hypothetical protein